MSMSDAVIANLQSPKPILQQDKSTIITNPFIPNEQREKEIVALQSEANAIIEEEYKQNKTSSIQYQSLAVINKNIASSITGLIDDLFLKPADTQWKDYLPIIFQKEQRYTYIGILFLFIVLFYTLVTRE